MSSWHSYSKIYNLGHPYLKTLLQGPVTIEEKIDGSQFSFGIFNGELKCRSKGQELVLDAPEKMFTKAVEVVKMLAPSLTDGWTYRAEYLQKPKHNVLAYDRTPENNLIIYDINTDQENYVPREVKVREAARLGLEVVPAIDVNPESLEDIKRILDRVSCLGGQKIEGIVIKNYNQFGMDKKVLMGKHVSEAFKEVHKGEWKLSNPSKGDLIDTLCAAYKTPARWNKAIQHLTEKGQLEGTPKDIGILMKEVQADIVAECINEIEEQLVKWALPKILRASIGGLPEWYKNKLVEAQFADKFLEDNKELMEQLGNE